MKTQAGFTLIEILITIALVALLIGAGLPAFGDLVKNNRITTQANSVIASFHHARNESVNRSVDVRLEPVVAGTDWSAGWRVRIDGNDDGDFGDAEDIILRNYEAVDSSSLTSTTGNIIYSPNGQAAPNATLTLLANDCTGEHKRVINIKRSGHVWLDQDDKSCP